MPTETDRIERRALAPIGRWARAKYGRMTALSVEVSRLAGRRVHRQAVEMWLRRKQPVSPRYGMAMLVIFAYEKLKAVEEEDPSGGGCP